MEEIRNECVVMERDGRVHVERGVLSRAAMEPGSVLLQTLLGEVCGTDVHLSHARLDTVPYPIIPGHVAVGRVHSSVGPVSDVQGNPYIYAHIKQAILKVSPKNVVQVEAGDIITFLDVIDTCNSCVACMVDKQSTRCPKRRVLGITCSSDVSTIRGLLGGWSSYIYLPPRTKLIKLPPNLPPHIFMAGGCGLPTALHAIDRANIKLMDRVVVQGSGPVGLMAALMAKASGALQVIVIGAPEHRLEVIQKFGIKDVINIEKCRKPLERQNLIRELTGGHRIDVVIEATGRPEAVSEGMDICRDGGTYVIVGQYTDNGSVDINPHFQINRKHLSIKGCWGSDFSHFYRGVHFMAHHSHLPWDLVISRVYELKDAQEALASVEKMEVFKALLRPSPLV